MARGARGESTIVKGDDGRWHGYVSMGLKPAVTGTGAMSQPPSGRM